MKKKLIIALGGAAVVVVAIVGVFVYNNTRVTAEYASDYNRIFGEFTAESTNKLLKGKKENTCYSPASLFATLALTAECTTGDTREEILEGLNVDSMESLQENYARMFESIDVETQNTKIQLANSLWIDNEYIKKASDDIIRQCEEKYSCEVFKEDGLKGAKINLWVSKNTNGLVKEIVESDEKYSLMLANTLYFKARWEYKLGGKDEEFLLENGDLVDMRFNLSKSEKMEYKILDDYSVVKVPLKTGEMAMILPSENKKLDSLLKEKMLNNIMATVTGNNMNEGDVIVCFPSFECECSYEKQLFETLKDMGMKSIVSGKTEWSICDGVNNEDVDIRQKVKIKVDNIGVEAVAATSLGPSLAGELHLKPDLEITFNRPFMYILMKDGVPLFIGTVYNPAE